MAGLDEVASFFESGKMVPVPHFPVGANFTLQDAVKAFSYSAGSGGGGVNDHIGKIIMVTA